MSEVQIHNRVIYSKGTFAEQLKEARDSGLLEDMYKRGLIDHKPTYYLDIYLDKTNKHLTYQQMADRLGCSKSTVLRAINAIKEKEVTYHATLEVPMPKEGDVIL